VGSFINYAVILVVILLVISVLLQSRGASGGLFGAETTFRTRRGVERTLFQITIGLAIVFFALAILNLRFG
jgi:preprotein translocase subunit SecG